MIRLHSSRLSVEIANPGEPPNDTDRFDRAGYITEIVLDQRHRFCANEPANLSHPCSGGRGLCNEYQSDHSQTTKIGETFPKFGVGLFVKPDQEPYCFHRKYEKLEFPIDFTWDEKSACYTMDQRPCQGYGLKSKKTIEVAENVLTMTNWLENVGERVIDLREYCHNFISFDGMALGPGYKISMPNITDRGHDILNGTIKGDGHGFTFAAYNPNAASVKVDAADIAAQEQFAWRMTHTGINLSMDVTEYFRPHKIVIWAVDHIISVEAFHAISLKPGQTALWKRSWAFNS